MNNKNNIFKSSIFQNIMAFLCPLFLSTVVIYAMMIMKIPFNFQHDSYSYIYPALGLYHLHQYINFVSPEIYHPELSRLIVYPYFLCIIYKIFGLGNNFAVVVCQAMLMGLTSVAIISIVRTFYPKLIWVGLIITITCINLFSRSAQILPDLMFSALIVFGLYFLLATPFKKLMWNISLSGLFFGIAFLTRPALLLYPLFTLPFLVYFLHKKITLSLKVAGFYAFVWLAIIGVFFSAQLNYEKQYTGAYLYTVQSGEHPLFWVYPALYTPWGGRRNITILNKARQLYATRRLALPKSEQNDLGKLVKLQHTLFFESVLHMPKLLLLKGIVGSSLKYLFYTSMLGTAETFHHHIPHFKLHHPFKSVELLLVNPWQVLIFFSQSLLVILRVVQLIGVIDGVRDTNSRPLTLYLLFAMLSFVAVSVGMGNPRLRAPIEVVLIIFTAQGVNAIMKMLEHRKKHLNYQAVCQA